MTRRRPPKWAESLNARDVDDIMDAALQGTGPRTKRKQFAWRGHRLVLTFTNLRALVDTIAGEPVCCRWG